MGKPAMASKSRSKETGPRLKERIGATRCGFVLGRSRTFLPIVFTILAAACSSGAPSTPRSAVSTPGPVATQGQIAFASERDGNAEIYVMNADGRG